MENSVDERQSNSFLTFFTGLLVGSAVGTIIGLLLAPKSGTETRHQISENMSDGQSKAKQIIEETKSNISQSVDSASKNIESTVNRVVDAFNAGSKAAKDSVDEQNIAKTNKSDKMIDVKPKNINVDSSDKVNKKNTSSEIKEVKSEKVDG